MVCWDDFGHTRGGFFANETDERGEIGYRCPRPEWHAWLPWKPPTWGWVSGEAISIAAMRVLLGFDADDESVTYTDITDLVRSVG